MISVRTKRYYFRRLANFDMNTGRITEYYTFSQNHLDKTCPHGVERKDVRLIVSQNNDIYVLY